MLNLGNTSDPLENELRKLEALAKAAANDLSFEADAINALSAFVAREDVKAAPKVWARAMFALGERHFSRFRRNTQGFDEAEAAYRCALEVWTRAEHELDWAKVQHSLGILYAIRYQQSAQCFDDAEAAYRCALEVLRPDTPGHIWCTARINHGFLRLTRCQRTDSADLGIQAQRDIRQALGELNRSAFPKLWARAQSHLGRTAAWLYRAFAQLEDGVEAFAAFSAAALAYGQLGDFAAMQDALAGMTAVDDGGSSEAHGMVLRSATDELHALYLLAESDEDRRHLLAQFVDLYRRRAVWSLTHEGPLPAMARQLEGVGRTLSDAVGLHERARRARLEGLDAALLQLRRSEQLRSQAKQALYRSADSVDMETAKLNAELAQQQFQTTRSSFRREFERAGLIEPPLTASQLAALPLGERTAALVVILDKSEGHALLLRRGTAHPVRLPLTLGRAHALLKAETEAAARQRACYERYVASQDGLDAARQGWEQSAELDSDPSVPIEPRSGADDAVWNLAALEIEYLAAAVAWQDTLREIAVQQTDANAEEIGWIPAFRLAYEYTSDEGHPGAVAAAQSLFKRTVARVVDTLRSELWQPLENALEGIDQILFVPTGPLAALPFHAAAPAGIAVAVEPSLRVWEGLTARVNRATSRAGSRLVVATPALDLASTAAEGAWLPQRVAAQASLVLDGDEATHTRLLEEAVCHEAVHFAGHGRYEWHKPLQSTLACADGALTVQDIYTGVRLNGADSAGVRLVTLSACSSGLSDVLLNGDEFVGLPGMLLEAGATAVVGSLWPVHDYATAFLMDRFYEQWMNGGGSIAFCLQEAYGWLRTATRRQLLARVAALGVTSEVAQQIAFALGNPVDTGSLTRGIAAESRGWDGSAQTRLVNELVSGPLDGTPYDEPYYWAAFAAYGAVLD